MRAFGAALLAASTLAAPARAPPSFRGGSLAARWRVAPPWAIGIAGGFYWSGMNDGASHTLWQTHAEGRFHPFAPTSIDPWLGALLGVAAAADTLNDAPATGPRSRTALAPSAGLGAGVDFRIASSLSVEVAARGLVLSFPEPEPLGPGETTDYGGMVWMSLALGVVFHPPLGAR